jgi:RHS repeat-associated protein
MRTFRLLRKPPAPRSLGQSPPWGGVDEVEYRFERLDGSVWSTVQAYSANNVYTWTPAAGDVGTHSVRVSVRNSGSTADFEDQKTMPITITSGSGALAPRGDSLLTRVLERLLPQRVALSMSVTARYASQAAGDVQRHSIYTPELNLMSESETSTSSTPAVAYDYIWFAGKPVAQVDLATNTTHWTFTDHLGTPILQTDATGTIDWRAEYEPFGALYTLRTGATRHQPLRFPGQEADGLNGEREYNIFRWYRAGWGRYTQGDPIGLKAGSNLYEYGSDNAIRNFDQRGLTCSRSCPECASKTWVFYGVQLGFTVGIGSLSYGASVAIMDAHCWNSTKTCTYLVTCSNLFGIGASVGLSGTVGLAFNAPCSDDVGGLSWGFDASILAGSGGTGSFSSSPSGNFSVGLGAGIGGGASGTFQLCDAHKLSCR